MSAATAFGAKTNHDVEGYVLSVEAGDVLVDLGSNRGVAIGDVLELWRSIELVHPVTKQRIRDRYRIGTLKLVQVRDRIAVAVAETTKLEPKAGDSVVLRGKTPPPPPAPPPATPSPSSGASKPSSEEASDAEKVNALFESLRDAPLAERIRAYIAYAKKNPASPYARVLHDDAVQFYQLLHARPGEEGEGAAGPTPRETTMQVVENTPSVDFDPPAHAVEGRGLELALHAPPAFVGAVLHARANGEIGYRSSPMTEAGSGYFQGVIPADAIRAPKTEYFIEVVDAGGRAVPVAGSDDAPFYVDVERPPDAAPPALQRRTTVSVLTDWADFNRLRSNQLDRTWQTEGTLGMRFNDLGIRAVRTGFGVYRGVSGSLAVLDDPSILHPREREVGLTYGYLEGEFGILHAVSIVARVVAGLNDSGATSGGLAAVRIGNDLETNLSLGFEVLGGIGMRSITELQMHPTDRFVVLLRSEVTNQPAGTSDPNDRGAPELGGDLGLRGIVQPGYELWPGFVLSVRLSYQGRTIYHAGPGFGGAVSNSW